MLLSFVQVFAVLAATAQAVNVGGLYHFCRQRALDTCLKWPQGTLPLDSVIFISFVNLFVICHRTDGSYQLGGCSMVLYR